MNYMLQALFLGLFLSLPRLGGSPVQTNPCPAAIKANLQVTSLDSRVGENLLWNILLSPKGTKPVSQIKAELLDSQDWLVLSPPPGLDVLSSDAVIQIAVLPLRAGNRHPAIKLSYSTAGASCSTVLVANESVVVLPFASFLEINVSPSGAPNTNRPLPLEVSIVNHSPFPVRDIHLDGLSDGQEWGVVASLAEIQPGETASLRAAPVLRTSSGEIHAVLAWSWTDPSGRQRLEHASVSVPLPAQEPWPYRDIALVLVSVVLGGLITTLGTVLNERLKDQLTRKNEAELANHQLKGQLDLFLGQVQTSLASRTAVDMQIPSRLYEEGRLVLAMQSRNKELLPNLGALIRAANEYNLMLADPRLEQNIHEKRSAVKEAAQKVGVLLP